MDNKNKISFEGKGNLKIKYQKYTEADGQKLIEILGGYVGKFVGDVKNEMRELLLKGGVINESGDAIKLPPKQVLITDGNDVFDDKLIQNAEFVILDGGHLDENLTAKNILFKKGDYSNVEITGDVVKIDGSAVAKGITANKLIVKTEVASPTTVEQDAFFYDAHNNHEISLKVKQTLHNYGKSIINDGSEVNMMENHDNTTICGGVVKDYMNNYDSTRIYWGTVNGTMSNNNSTTVMNGTVNGTMINHDSAKVYNGTTTYMNNYDSTEIRGGVVKEFMENNDSTKVYYVQVENNMTNRDNTEVYGGQIKDMYNYGSAKVYNVLVRGNMKSAGGTEIHGVNVFGQMETEGSTKIYNAIAAKMYLSGNTQVLGTVRGKIQRMGKEVIIGENAKFDEVALSSLPISRWNIRINPNYRFSPSRTKV